MHDFLVTESGMSEIFQASNLVVFLYIFNSCIFDYNLIINFMLYDVQKKNIKIFSKL